MTNSVAITGQIAELLIERKYIDLYLSTRMKMPIHFNKSIPEFKY